MGKFRRGKKKKSLSNWISYLQLTQHWFNQATHAILPANGESDVKPIHIPSRWLNRHDSEIAAGINRHQWLLYTRMCSPSA